MREREVKGAIRQAMPGEAADVASVVRRSFQDVATRFGLTPQNCPRHPSNCAPEWIANAMAKGVTFYVAEIDGRMCGSVGMTPHQDGVCKIVSLAVLADSRRNGLGRALVDRVLQEAQMLGLKTVEIAIVAEHAELRRWYEKIGFVWDRAEAFDGLPFEVGFMNLDLQSIRKERLV